MEYILLVIGFILLIKGADLFVDGSVGVAKLLRVPSIIIGLTVVAFGTSMPEASVSITAALQGKNDLAVSNVIGSNIFNLLIVLGASALVRPVKAGKQIMEREFPFSIIITALLLIFISKMRFAGVSAGTGEYVLGRMGGAVFLLLFVYFLAATGKDALKARKEIAGDKAESIRKMFPETEETERNRTPDARRSLVYAAAGMSGIILGGNFVTGSAAQIARDLGLGQTFIGLTVVALGTSLPELVTSMVAAGKGENDIAAGNVVGSNIFNILLILGVSAVITPIRVSVLAVCDTAALAAASIVVYLCAFGKKGITRNKGAFFILLYAVYFSYILTR